MDNKNEVYDQHFAKLVQANLFLKRQFYISLQELVFVGSFVANFLIGKIIHLFSPKEEVNNYWNDKHNIFNLLFVKKGWLWTTVVVVIFYGCTFVKTRRQNVNFVKVLVRYLVSTGWWVLFTQWCFGLPIMDRIFVWTGGYCFVNPDHPQLNQFVHLFDHDSDANVFQSNSITSLSCRRLNGTWKGGHDPSGHVFLMVHSSLYLFFETVPYWQSFGQLCNSLKVYYHKFQVSKQLGDLIGLLMTMPQLFVAGLIGLWWFMLLMTNIYFHSLGEKFVGLIFGYVGVVVLYYLPRLKKQ